MSLLRSAIQTLRKEGFIQLGKSTFEFSHNKVENALLPALFSQIKTINNNDILENISINSGIYEKPELVEINGSASERERDLPKPIRQYFGRYYIDPLFWYEIQNGVLYPDLNTVFTSEGEVISCSLGNSKDLHRTLANKIGSFPFSVTVMLNHSNYSRLMDPEEYISEGFDMTGSTNYFHWVTETLPRIRALHNYEEETNRKLPLLVEQDPPEWKVDYLSLIGLGERITPVPSQSITVGNLISTPHRYRRRPINGSNLGFTSNDYRRENPFIPSTRDLNWVRERYQDAISAESWSDNNNIFISREDADRRHIVNRDEFLDGVSQLGFEKYTLADMSVSEQINLFANADCVVGTHGAGLANTIFSNDIQIFEIIPSDFYWHDFYCMSEQLGFDYDYYRAYRNQSGDNATRHDDLYVDVEIVRDRIENLIKN